MKNFLLIGVMLLGANIAFAQKYTATFDDGTKVDYEVVETQLNQMHKWAVELPTKVENGKNFNLLQVYYHQPDQFRASAFIGMNTYGADGIYYVKSWSKQKALKLPLKSSYTGVNEMTTYYAKIEDARKSFYLGPHLAIAKKTWENSSKLTGYEIGAGFALTRGRHAKWIIQGRKRPVSVRGTTFNSLIFDLNYYTGLKNETVSKDSPYYNKPVNDLSKPIGAKIYYEGRTGFVSHREFGIHYSIGASMSANKNDTKPGLIAGFGLYFGF